jgi:hypothetical protein
MEKPPVELVVAGARYVLDPASTHEAPVYRSADGVSHASATGRVFVRFDDGTDAATHTEELSRLGYRVEGIPSYAPHAAWILATDGSPGTALAGLPALQRLPGVRHVEPELLRTKSERD